MIKRYLKVYPSIYYTKHVYSAPQVSSNGEVVKKDYVFNQYGKEGIHLNNKLKKGNDKNAIKRVYYFKLWNALTQYNFTLFENIIQQFLNEGHMYDEVIYSIIVHSYVLNHRKKVENAYLVIEEMKRCYMHPAIIKINERMINSYLELEMIFCEPSKSLWMNICRLTWEVSIKLNRERKRKLKEKLNLLPPNEVLKLTKEDLKLMLKKEYEDSLVNMIDTMSLDNETPYEHMMIEESQIYNEKENEEENTPSLSLLGKDMTIIDNHNENSSIYVDAQSNYIDGKIKQDENDIYMLLKNDTHNVQSMSDWDDDWGGDDGDEKEENEKEETYGNDEDFDIQLLEKYYNRKS
ncbi:hypothetical protein YYE_04346 [Plasmodium vinckei vinckei]|uniref:Uncharacterized protein n=1 Tax=Plasmodium vinckei vinckei TaxID=54757 RepID=A0A081IB42_PLAVN|nr:hypothetical protein YYE_04346 [Plasmodium vinckei vinckei]